VRRPDSASHDDAIDGHHAAPPCRPRERVQFYKGGRFGGSLCWAGERPRERVVEDLPRRMANYAWRLVVEGDPVRWHGQLCVPVGNRHPSGRCRGQVHCSGRGRVRWGRRARHWTRCRGRDSCSARAGGTEHRHRDEADHPTGPHGPHAVKKPGPGVFAYTEFRAFGHVSRVVASAPSCTKGFGRLAAISHPATMTVMRSHSGRRIRTSYEATTTPSLTLNSCDPRIAAGETPFR